MFTLAKVEPFEGKKKSWSALSHVQGSHSLVQTHFIKLLFKHNKCADTESML
jgi:hypothetical protein